MRLAYLLTFLAPTAGWVTLSQSRYGVTAGWVADQFRGAPGTNPYSQLGYVWHMPRDVADMAGLGGGIAWAWADALCDKLLPTGPLYRARGRKLFREDFFFFDFVTCDELRAAMHRAFNSWSDNHRFINFIDVTEGGVPPQARRGEEQLLARGGVGDNHRRHNRRRSAVP